MLCNGKLFLNHARRMNRSFSNINCKSYGYSSSALSLSHNWEQTNKNDSKHSIINQRLFMDELSKRLNLKSLEDWKTVTKSQIRENGGYSILKQYSHDIPNLLKTIYPHHNWQFDEKTSFTTRLQYFASLDNQRNFMEKLFKKYKLKTLEDWLDFPKVYIRKNGGKILLDYYQNNFHKLLSSLYSHYAWQFNQLGKLNSHEYFKSRENQLKFMDFLFKKLKLQSLDEWPKVSRRQFFRYGGKSLYTHYYRSDIKLLLTSIYPTHQWNWNVEFSRSKRKYFEKIYNQQLFMTELYHRFALNRLEEFELLTKKDVINHGGKILLRQYYQGDIQSLLSTVFPNYPWEFDLLLQKDPHEYFKSIDNQRKFMDKLFVKLRLKSLDDWMFVSQNQFLRNKGKSLLFFYYQRDMEKMLREIYTDHNWDFSKLDFSLLSNQTQMMQKIFESLKLKKLDDWKKVTRFQMLTHGGRKLLQYYANDFKALLQSIYPSHNWNSSLKYRPDVHYFKTSHSFNLSKLALLQSTYLVQQKNDWYRVPAQFDEINVYRALKLIYSDDEWDRKLFNIRSKKTNQRLLFSYLYQLYRSYLLIENYRHPYLSISGSPISLEFDIFIPSLNIAFEYQGEHHFNEIPGTQGFLEIYRTRDHVKAQLATIHSIKLITIPYWWDLSLPSLYSSFNFEMK